MHESWQLTKLIRLVQELKNDQVAEWRIQLANALFQLANIAIGTFIFTQLIGGYSFKNVLGGIGLLIALVCYTFSIKILKEKNE